MKQATPEYWNALRAKSVKKYQEKRKPKKPLSQKSKKRIEQSKIYAARKKAYFKLQPTCEYPGCNQTNVTLHHKRGRSGDLLINDLFFCSLCWVHHQWVELHPIEAKKLGLSLDRL